MKRSQDPHGLGNFSLYTWHVMHTLTENFLSKGEKWGTVRKT